MLQRLIFVLCLHLQLGNTADEDEINYLTNSFYIDLDGRNWADVWDVSTENTYSENYVKLTAEIDKLTWDSERLVTMNLTENGLEGSIPNGIEALTELYNLTLSDNEITYLPDLANNTKLHLLNLSLNLLSEYTGTFPASLNFISLQNNSISTDLSVILSNIESLDTLKELNLDGNSVTGSLTEDLLTAANLTWLGLSGNQITGDLPDNIRSDNWENLDLGYNKLTGDYPSVLLNNEAVNLRCNMFDCSSLSSFNATTYGIHECMCPERGYEAAVDDSTGHVTCSVCANGTMANKWVRFETTDDTYYCTIPTEGCVNCMFSKNCVEGSCTAGSTGPTCEVCENGYRMIGGKCEECLESQVPIAALAMLVFVAVIIGYGIFLTGLNMLAATMIKQLFTYLQLYFLTMDIRANWPYSWAELADVYKLSMINTQAFDLDCLVSSLSTLDLFYIDWTSAIVVPIILTLVIVAIDKNWSQKITSYEKNVAVVADIEKETRTAESLHFRSKQAGMRRIYIMYMLIAFVPVTTLSVRVYACDDWSIDTITVKYNDGNDVIANQWFYDNSVDCYDPTFQGIAFIATALCILEFGIAMFLFLILFRLWRFDLKDKQNEIFGALYESFNENGLFCEPCLLIRKFILILTTQVTYVDPLASGIVNVFLSFVWLIFIVIRQPYIAVTEGGRIFAVLNNWCNLFEIAASFLITLTQTFALIDGFDSSIWTENPVVLDIVSYVILVLHVLLVIIWIVGFITVLVKFTKAGIKDKRSRRSLRSQASRSLLRTPGTAMMKNPGARVTPTNDDPNDDLTQQMNVAEDAL